MVNEERSLRTRRVSGSKRRIARRTWRRILQQLYCVRELLAARTGLVSDRLNALMKPTAITRPHPLAFVEVDATPATARVGPALVVPQRLLRARSASKASAAR